MPSDIICTSCRLAFSAGWFHFHGKDTDDYPTASLLVCTNCGTMHQVEFGLTDHVPIPVRLVCFLRELRKFMSKEEQLDGKGSSSHKSTGVADKLFA